MSRRRRGATGHPKSAPKTRALPLHSSLASSPLNRLPKHYPRVEESAHPPARPLPACPSHLMTPPASHPSSQRRAGRRRVRGDEEGHAGPAQGVPRVPGEDGRGEPQPCRRNRRHAAGALPGGQCAPDKRARCNSRPWRCLPPSPLPLHPARPRRRPSKPPSAMPLRHPRSFASLPSASRDSCASASPVCHLFPTEGPARP